MKITIEWLEQQNACLSQQDIFKTVFPSGTDITRETCVMAAQGGLDLRWLSRQLFNWVENAYFRHRAEDLGAEYTETCEPALKVYNKATHKDFVECVMVTRALNRELQTSNLPHKEAVELYEARLAELRQRTTAAVAEPTRVYNETVEPFRKQILQQVGEIFYEIWSHCETNC